MKHEVSKLLVLLFASVVVAGCTISMSIQKNNSSSTQKTEQTSTSTVDSTSVNINR